MRQERTIVHEDDSERIDIRIRNRVAQKDIKPESPANERFRYPNDAFCACVRSSLRDYYNRKEDKQVIERLNTYITQWWFMTFTKIKPSDGLTYAQVVTAMQYKLLGDSARKLRVKLSDKFNKRLPAAVALQSFEQSDELFNVFKGYEDFANKPFTFNKEVIMSKSSSSQERKSREKESTKVLRGDAKRVEICKLIIKRKLTDEDIVKAMKRDFDAVVTVADVVWNRNKMNDGAHKKLGFPKPSREYERIGGKKPVEKKAPAKKEKKEESHGRRMRE